MDAPEKSIPLDGKRWVWLQRLIGPFVIAAAIICGLVAWDHHDYPVAGFGDPRDPFATSHWPKPVDGLGETLFRLRGKLHIQKSKRIYRKRLANLDLVGSEWLFVIDGTPSVFGEIVFKTNKTLVITPPRGAAEELWFSATKYRYDPSGKVGMSSPQTSHIATIGFYDDQNLHLTIRTQTGPSTYQASGIYLMQKHASASQSP